MDGSEHLRPRADAESEQFGHGLSMCVRSKEQTSSTETADVLTILIG